MTPCDAASDVQHNGNPRLFSRTAPCGVVSVIQHIVNPRLLSGRAEMIFLQLQLVEWSNRSLWLADIHVESPEANVPPEIVSNGIL